MRTIVGIPFFLNMMSSDSAFDASQHLTKLGSKKLSQFIEKIGPIDIPQRYGDDLLLGLARIIVGQQLSNQAAASIWRRLETAYPQRSRLLVALADVATPNTGLSASKQRTLGQIMGLGDEWILRISKLDAEQRSQMLLNVWGIGPWSVAMWELFVLGHQDQWSDNDLILRRVSEELAADAGSDRIMLIAAASPFRSYLALYAWRLNDSLKASRE
jgi:DNA-3-methyladenine glycosylase II